MNHMETKKAFWHAAIAVIAICSFSACASSEEDELQNSENERGVVKTEFTIAFPQQMYGTRMALDIVQGQATPVFRGIQDIELIPFSSAKAEITSSTTLPSAINLPAGDAAAKFGYSATTANAIASSGALYAKSNSHLYKDIEIAIGTRAFMFYGLATNKEVAGQRSNSVNGALKKEKSGATLDGITFSPNQIRTETEIDAQATNIAEYLTKIANTKASETATETMLTLFPNFEDIHPGSWASVKAAVQQVYTSVYNNTDALSQAIKNTILTKATDNAGTEGASTGVLDFSTGEFKTYSYPRNIYLPDGAAYVSWDSENKKFNVLTQDNMGLNVATLGTYVDPAPLYYFGLSNIKAVDNSMNSYYNSEDRSWSEIITAYNAPTSSDVVQSTTRSIAIVDEVQYAVGRLDITVVTKDGKTSLTDNEGKNIEIGTEGANFPITGILVSNQKAVDYKFETKPSATAYTVYDSQTVPATETDAEKAPRLYPASTYPEVRKTHTLLLQTLDATSDDDENANVNIAIEFENRSGKIIVGKDNQLIYPNTRFYLVGTLKPNLNDRQKYIGTKTNIKKAFVQDYVTTANFTVESFKNAYNYLPDLRIPHLEIGLSVDLTWKPGIIQDITIE